MIDKNFKDQIDLFKSLFKGRDDFFAVRWEKGSKNGYMPSYHYDPKYWCKSIYFGLQIKATVFRMEISA